MFRTSCCLAFVFCWTVSDLIVSLRAYKCELYDCLDRLKFFPCTDNEYSTQYAVYNTKFDFSRFCYTDDRHQLRDKNAIAT